MRAKRYKQLALLLGMALFLVGCGNDSEAKAELLIQNFSIVDDYEYDRVKVVVEDELTPEEVAKDILADAMNLNITLKDKYDEFGISPSNGIFVSAAILDGPEIPKEPGFDKQAAIQATNNNTNNNQDFLVAKYDELQRNRQNIVSGYSQDDTLVDITDTINRRLNEQTDRIQEQQEHQRLQEEIFGVPELVEIDSYE